MEAANKLATIVADTRAAVARQRLQANATALRQAALAAGFPEGRFYRHLGAQKAVGKPILITEYKRRSPSDSAIGLAVPLEAQVAQYLAAGATGVSILTNTPHFGGSLDDLIKARALLGNEGPVLLRKDFILDPLQLYEARLAGADAVLLMASILSPQELHALLDETHALGMGALVELHQPKELGHLKGLNAPVIGVNNRDLRDFSLRLNRANQLAPQLPPGAIRIAESGIDSALAFRIATHRTDGALVGTALMREPGLLPTLLGPSPYLFKACGIRAPEHLQLPSPDLIGLNFSPRSKRRIDPDALNATAIPRNGVAVFYQNTAEEVEEILTRLPFRWVQRYAEDISPEAFGRHTQRSILAMQAGPGLTETAQRYAYHTDLFLLDGSQPGAGIADTVLPDDFPYPFLLAGGIHPANLDRVRAHPNCIGVDVASGIETNGTVDPTRVSAIRAGLATLTAQHTPA